MPETQLHIGPAGWSFPEWDGLFYPESRPRGFHALEHVARHFNMVEVNASFHQPLRPEVSRLWVKKVERNPGFLFTAKLQRRFTHDRILLPEEINRYREGIEPLAQAGRLGAVLMQFPWSFRYTEENREYLIRLRRSFARLPLVAEMRHSSWTAEEAVGTLVDYHIGFVNIDQPEHARGTRPSAILTTGVGYVRLHGRSAEGWFDDFGTDGEAQGRFGYLYSPAELTEWKPRIERLRQHAQRVFVVATNRTGAKSLVNLLQIREMFGQAGEARVPAGLLRRYPVELGGHRPDAPVQQVLFAA